MAEGLGVAASVIAVATLVWESSKQLYELVNGLSKAPQAISRTKANLSAMQSALDTLRLSLTAEKSAAFDSLLQRLRVAEAINGLQEECDRFGRKIKSFTKHSEGATFSKRDGFIVNLPESEIDQFNGRLQDHRQVNMLVTTSMNLSVSIHATLLPRLIVNRIISKSSSTDAQQLSERFTKQETDLNALNMQLTQQLSDLSLSSRANEAVTSAAEDRDWSINSISTLQSICQDSISATSEARLIKQTFGDLSADNSRFYEGIAGRAQGNVTQIHGNATVAGGSTAARGQMDADTFKIMFGSHQYNCRFLCNDIAGIKNLTTDFISCPSGTFGNRKVKTPVEPLLSGVRNGPELAIGSW